MSPLRIKCLRGCGSRQNVPPAPTLAPYTWVLFERSGISHLEVFDGSVEWWHSDTSEILAHQLPDFLKRVEPLPGVVRR